MAQPVFTRLLILMLLVFFSVIITTITLVRREQQVIAEYSTNDDGVIGHSTTVKLSSEDKRKQKFGALDFSTEVDCDYDCQMEIQNYRKETITEQCAALGMASNHHNTTLNPKVIRKLEHFLVLDKYKIIYCYIPKAGCTNWKRVLLVLSGKANSTQSIGQKETHVLTSKYIRSLSTYTISEAKYRLENYVKFTFVRNPFVRLLSAYRDKLEKRTSLNGVFRKDWSKKMKKLTEAFKRYRLRGMDLNTTFHEYVEYVSDPQNNLLDPAEEHWIEMFRLSHPCAINFDFIGRVETLDRDTNFVLRNIIGISPKKILFRNSTNPTNSSDGRLLQKYFSDVPRKDVRALYQRFAPDFKLFGYEDPISLLEED